MSEDKTYRYVTRLDIKYGPLELPPSDPRPREDDHPDSRERRDRPDGR